MEAAYREEENAHHGGEDDHTYDERSLTEGEKDLDTEVQDRAEPDAGSAQGSSHQRPPVVGFFLNYLFENNMTETLLSFETEWHELEQKELLDARRVEPVPDVYVENQRLRGELRSALREREESRKAASVTAGMLARVQRDRDLYRNKHKQGLWDTKGLKKEVKRLKEECDISRENMKRMNKKYLAAVRQVRLALDSQSDASSESEEQDQTANQTPVLMGTSRIISQSDASSEYEEQDQTARGQTQ